MSKEKIVTLFDTVEHAEAAKRNLIKADFSESNISIINSHNFNNGNAVIEERGFWERLFGDEMHEDYPERYSSIINKGGAILTLRVDEDDQAKALAILNRHQLVDVPARVHGADVSQTTDVNSLAKTASITGAAAASAETVTPNLPEMLHENTDTMNYLTGNESKEEILRLAKEELEVGKRLVTEGTTRIHRYTDNHEVCQSVTLHEEHADIIRNAVDRSADGKDIDWSEKTVEITETVEKPVVNKTAHIVEEVLVKKTGSDHEERICDTVREQHVDVDRMKEGRDEATNFTQPRK